MAWPQKRSPFWGCPLTEIWTEPSIWGSMWSVGYWSEEPSARIKTRPGCWPGVEAETQTGGKAGSISSSHWWNRLVLQAIPWQVCKGLLSWSKRQDQELRELSQRWNRGNILARGRHPSSRTASTMALAIMVQLRAPQDILPTFTLSSQPPRYILEPQAETTPRGPKNKLWRQHFLPEECLQSHPGPACSSRQRPMLCTQQSGPQVHRALLGEWVGGDWDPFADATWSPSASRAQKPGWISCTIANPQYSLSLGFPNGSSSRTGTLGPIVFLIRHVLTGFREQLYTVIFARQMY